MATPVSLTLSPLALTPGVGKTTQMTATVTFDDATTEDVTALCVWSSSNPAIATVSSSGLVTAVSVGSATISASLMQTGAIVKTTVATDDFNRADGTLTSGNWVKPSAYTYAVDLVGQRLRAPQAWSGKKAGANWATPMSSPDNWAALKVSATQDGNNTSGYKGVRVRSNEAGDTYYFAAINNTMDNVIHLGKCVAGTVSVFSGSSPTADPGDTFELRVVGNQLTVYKNGVATALTQTDSSITTGNYIGIHLEGQIGNTTYYYMDDFAGGDWRSTSVTVTGTASLTSHVVIPRFRLNGPFESSLKATEALSQMLGTFAGLLTWSQGQWVMSFAALKEPVLDLDYSDARGPIQYQAAVSLRDKCNAVKGVYISPDNEWQPSDFPAYINAQYVAEDSGKYGTRNRGKWFSGVSYKANDAVVNGANCWVAKVDHTSSASKEPGNGAESATYWDAVTNIIWRDIRLPFTLTASEAQRLAKYECVRSRQRPMKYIAGPRAYSVRPGEIITVTHSRFGWDKKRFEMVSTALEIVDGGEAGPELHVPLVLREDDPLGYGWIHEVEADPVTPPGPIKR